MTVVKIKAAQPFILIVVQSGSKSLLIFGFIPRFFSVLAIVIGKVPDEDFEKKATANAGDTAFKVDKGLMPFAPSHRGRIIKPCIKLARRTTSKYSPTPAALTPDLS